VILALVTAALAGAAYGVRSSEDHAPVIEMPQGDSGKRPDWAPPAHVRRVMDEAGFLDPYGIDGLEGYLAGINAESGVDIRFIFSDGVGDDIAAYSRNRAREMGIGREMDRRSMLFVYDVKGQRMRIEVGPQMEGMFPDGFVGYLMREQTAGLFASGRRNIALKSTLNIVSYRLREAALGGEYNPKAVAYITNPVRLAAGAGATTRAPVNTNVRPFGKRIATDEARAHFGPQPTPGDALVRYHEAMRDGHYEPDLSLYTPQSQLLLRSFQVSRPFAEFILLSEYGHSYKIVQRGDLAILFFTNTPLVSAHLFRRTPEGWQIDFIAEVRDTREFVGSPYTWTMVLTGDDYSTAFSDLFADFGASLVTGGAGYSRPAPTRILRPADGDNRPLPTRTWHEIPPARKAVVRAPGESRLLLPANGTKVEDFGYPTQTIDKLAVRRLLTSRKYDSLGAVLSAYSDSVTQDYRLEYRLFDAYDAFDAPIQSLEPLLDEWVTERPQSAPARLARGVYLAARGWNARGYAFAARTSRAQFRQMDSFFARAKVDYLAGMRLDPRSIVPYRGLMKMDKTENDDETMRQLLDQGLRIQPYSFRLRAVYIQAILPRWGGSYKAMTEFAEECAPYAARNPRINALAGFVDYDRGRVLEKAGKKAEAIKAYGRALSHGDFWQFRYERGDLYFHADRDKEALEDLNKAVGQNPQDADALYDRSWVSYDLGFHSKGDARSAYFAQAYDDIVLSVALDPTDEYHQKQLAFVRENLPAFAPPPRS
jgi:uncharacterized protein